MALERVLVSGASDILKKLVSAIASEISLAWGVKDELKKLQDTLELIDAKTYDAETKQVNDAEISLWLKRLKGAAYDADDVLDEFSYEAMRRSDKNKRKVKIFFSSSNQVSCRFKRAHKIKSINKQFNQIANDMKRFQFESARPNCRYDDQTAEKRKRLTPSFFGDDSKIVGREHDKAEIIKLLTSSTSSSPTLNSNQQEKVSVISIVGMGGVGKTTLAQSIYNSVEKHFIKRIWVCVSEEFDFYRILLNIMESISQSKCEEFSNINVLVDKVKGELKNELYLLVLDDLWNEDLLEWNQLKSVLDIGAIGSKIIVTTRKQNVASVERGIIPPYNLYVLSEADCWSIIKSKAFSPGGASETPNMKNIGEQIAKKCGGLPLAAVFFGGLMHSQNDERHWLSIRDNKSLETPENQSGGIIAILKLSYDNLSSQLKQCFSYCCLFPKDWVYKRETLIQLWMAEGFLNPPNGRNQNSVEDIGYSYLLNLLSNSFFQDVKKDHLGDIQEFKMHDLVHDLAQSVVGDHEVTILNASQTENDITDIRRLQLIMGGEEYEMHHNVLINAKKLRTFLCEGVFFGYQSPLSNKHLLVLCVRNGFNLENLLPLPFIHLRYLDLNYSDVYAMSIGQLYNLQTLNLRGVKCVKWVLNGIGSLRNLRHLDLHRSDVQVLPESIVRLASLQTLDISHTYITELPIDIGSLHNLESLDMSYTKIRKLPDSISRIYNFKKLEFRECPELRVLPCNFGALTQLRSLNVYGTGITELPESLTSSSLCNLESVDLGYFCVIPRDIKNWVKLRYLRYRGETRGIEMLSNLVILNTYSVRKEDQINIGTNASDFSGIEELANLNSLRELEIRQLENVRGKPDAERAKLKDKQNIQNLVLQWSKEEEEEMGNNNSGMVLDGLQPHLNLKILKIDEFSGSNFPKWMGSSSLPNLVRLYLSNCNGCEKLPALGMLPCLQVLTIDEMSSVKCLGQEFYYQQDEEEEEEEESRGTATTTILFPSLIELSIKYLEKLEEWVAPSPLHISFPILQNLTLLYCKRLTSIPDLRLCTSLRKLCILRCSKFKESYDLKKSLDFIKEIEIDDESNNFIEAEEVDQLAPLQFISNRIQLRPVTELIEIEEEGKEWLTW